MGVIVCYLGKITIVAIRLTANLEITILSSVAVLSHTKTAFKLASTGNISISMCNFPYKCTFINQEVLCQFIINMIPYVRENFW